MNKVSKHLENFDRLTITIIAYYETLRGFKDLGNQKKLDAFQDFIETCELVTLTKSTIDKAAEIYARLKKEGALIGDADILIAAIALVEGLVVVTDNTSHFQRIPELRVENWLV